MPMVAAAAVAVFGAVSAGAAVATAIGVTSFLGLSVATWSAIGMVGMAVSALALGLSMSSMMPKPSSTGTQLNMKLEPNPPLPVAYGRTATGGTIFYRESFGKSNDMLAMIVALSVGGSIAGYDGVLANDYTLGLTGSVGSLQTVNAVSGQSYKSKMFTHGGKFRIARRVGATPETQTPSQYAGVTLPKSPGKLSGIAHALMLMEYSQNTFPQGVPKVVHVVRGQKVYDPRLDDTYPGGEGDHRIDDPDTWEFSENPHLCALNWTLGRYQNDVLVYGIGATPAEVDLIAFVAGANIADELGWKVGGIVQTTDDKFAVLGTLLQAGGAVPVARGAQISVITNTIRTSIFNIGPEHVVGPAEVINSTAFRDRKNHITPRYRAESQFWQITNGEPVTASTYVEEDGGEVRSAEAEYPFVQDATQAHQLAAYDLVNGREFLQLDLTCKPELLAVRAGDCVTVTLPDQSLDGQKFLVVSRDFDPATWTVRLSLRAETDAKHAFALGQTAEAPASPSLKTFDPSFPEPPESGSWSITETTVSTGSGSNAVTSPALIIEGESDEPTAIQVLFEWRKPLVFEGEAPSADEQIEMGWLGEVAIDATATRGEITGLLPNQDYEVAVSYRTILGVKSQRLILGPIETGEQRVASVTDGGIDWTANTIANVPTAISDLDANGLIWANNIVFDGSVTVQAQLANVVVDLGTAYDELGDLAAQVAAYDADLGDFVDQVAVQAAIASSQANAAIANAALAAGYAGNAISAAGNAVSAQLAAALSANAAAANAVLASSNAGLAASYAGWAASNVTLAQTQVGYASANAALAFSNANLAANHAANSNVAANVATQQAAYATANAAFSASNATLSATRAGYAQSNATLATTQAAYANDNAVIAASNATLAATRAGYAQSNATLAQTQAGYATANAALVFSNVALAASHAANSNVAANVATTQAAYATANASLATSNATLAAAYASNAVAVVSTTLPSGFDGGLGFWTESASGPTASVATMANGSVQSVDTIGKTWRASGYHPLHSKGVVAGNRTYRASAKFRQLTDPTSGASIAAFGLVPLNADLQQQGPTIPASSPLALASDQGWHTVSTAFSTTASRANAWLNSATGTSWTRTGLNAPTATTAMGGTIAAWLFTVSGAGSLGYVSGNSIDVAAGQPVTFTVYLRGTALNTTFVLGIDGSVDGWGDDDLIFVETDIGTVTPSLSGGLVTVASVPTSANAGIVNRVRITRYSTVAQTVTPRVYLKSATAGDIAGTETGVIAGPQFELGHDASAYLISGATAASQTVQLLARTNRQPYSQDLDQWTVARCTVTAAAATAPDGSMTACRITDTSAASGDITITRINNFSVLAGKTYIVSGYAKYETCPVLQVYGGTGLTAFSANFDLANGVVGSKGAAVSTHAITAIGDGWYRWSLTGTAASTSTASEITLQQQISPTAAVGGNVVGAGRSYLLWGIQVEENAFASPYIATGATAVTVNDLPAYFRPFIAGNQGSVGDGSFEVAWLRIEDVTESTAANSSAILAQTQAGYATANAALASSNAILSATFAGYANDNAAVAANQAGFSAANATLATTQAGYATANSALAASNATLAATFSGYAAANAGLAATSAGYSAANATISTTQAGFANANAALASSNAILSATHSGYAAANAALSQTQAGYSTANAVLASTQAGYATANAALASSNATLSATYSGYAAANATAAQTQAGYSAANATIATAQAAYSTANAALATSNATLSATRAGYAQTNATIAQTQAGYALANAGLATSNATLAATFAGYANANATTALTQAGYSAANASISTAQAGFATSNAAFASSNATLALARAGYAQTNATVSTTQAGYANDNAALAASNATLAATRAGYALSNATLATTQAGYATANAALVFSNVALASGYAANASNAANYALSNATLATTQVAYASANAVLAQNWSNVAASHAANAIANGAALQASINAVTAAWTSNASAQALQLSTLTANVAGANATLTTQAGTISTLQGKTAAYFDIIAAAGSDPAYLKMNATSYGSNIMLAASSIGLFNTGGSGLTKVMEIVANAARFSSPVEIQVGTSKLVLGPNFGSSSNLVMWFGSNMAVNAMTTANSTFHLKNDGSAYFGGTLSAGVLRNSGQSSGLSSTEEFILGPFGTNGDSKTVTVSWTYTIYGSRDTNPSTQTDNVAATVSLYRSIAGGSYSLLATQSVSAGGATWNVESFGDPVDAPNPMGGNTGVLDYTFEGSKSISFTFTDTDTSSGDFTYKAVLSRSGVFTPGGSLLPSPYTVYDQNTQRLGIVSVEE